MISYEDTLVLMALTLSAAAQRSEAGGDDFEDLGSHFEGSEERRSQAKPEKMPGLIDDMKDSAAKFFDARPERFMILGNDGKMVYSGSRGPRGVDAAEFSPEDCSWKIGSAHKSIRGIFERAL